MTKGKNTDRSTTENSSRCQPAARPNLLKLCLTGIALASALTASAETLTTSTNFAVDAMIPDANKSGLVSAQTISTSITNLTSLKVALKVSGTWNGDLYCFLAHGTNRAVLMNRLGRGEASDLGYSDLGLDLTFDDAATNSDIHIYRLQLTGNQGTPITLTDSWAPDARSTSPISALDTDARSAFLGSFNGMDPNGEWVLFVADMEAGDIHFLDSWGLEMTGDTAPSEPEPSLAESAQGSAAGAALAGTVTNEPAAATVVAPAVISGLTADAGKVRLTFSGSAASTYAIERAAGLQGAGTVWTNIGTTTTDLSGRGEFTDTNPPAGQGYYRTVSQ